MSARALASVLELERFLEMLAGPARERGFLELRYRLEDGERMGRCFEHVTRLRGLATRARQLSRRVDVYVGCAPRERRAGTRDAVERGWSLWVDCDAPAAVDALERFQPQPAVVIASGSGRHRHAYWPLEAALSAGELERANRRLAFALGADLGSVTNAAALLRPPATCSHKHTPPAPVEALRLEPDRRLPAAAIVGELADPPAPTPWRRSRRAHGHGAWTPAGATACGSPGRGARAR